MPPPTSTILKPHITSFLHRRDPPKTFCPSEVARALTSSDLEALNLTEWREAMSPIREILWEMRAEGLCEIVQGGVSIGEHVGLEDVRGPIRVRRT
jgi:hypothetical protein